MPRLAGWQNLNIEVDNNVPVKRFNNLIFSGECKCVLSLGAWNGTKDAYLGLHQLNDPAVR
jgi:hypothetical protein